MGHRLIYPHIDPTINIGIWVLKSASTPSGLWLSVRSSQISMPKDWHWLGFIKAFSILQPNHKPWPNIGIMKSPDSAVCNIAPVNIGIFACSKYSARKGANVHYSDVNDIGCVFLSKKCVSAWLYISVEHAYQWICSCFLEVSSIHILDLVLLWNTSDCRIWQ